MELAGRERGGSHAWIIRVGWRSSRRTHPSHYPGRMSGADLGWVHLGLKRNPRSMRCRAARGQLAWSGQRRHYAAGDGERIRY
jgi:hypothetical protein